MRLPVELIQRIAGFCSLRDLVALRLTSSILRDICDDVLVVQQSFLNNADDPDSTAVPNKAALHRLVVTGLSPLSSKDPARAKAIWAALALAASSRYALMRELEQLLRPYTAADLEDETIFESLSNGSNPPWNGTLDDRIKTRRLIEVLGALNSLAVLGYSTIHDSRVTAALSQVATLGVLAKLNRILADYTTGANWYNLFRPERRAQRRYMEMRAKAKKDADNILPAALAVSFGLAMGTLKSQTPDYMLLCDSLSVYLVECAILRSDPMVRNAWTLFDSFESMQVAGLLITASTTWYIRTSSDLGARLRDDLPQPSYLPLLSCVQADSSPTVVALLGAQLLSCVQGYSSPTIMALLGGAQTGPTPDFSAFLGRSLEQSRVSVAWTHWLHSNTDALIANITHGEWVGYYTQTPLDGTALDPPMRGIRFVLDPPSPGDVIGVINLHSHTGTDNVGSFNLSGCIESNMGHVQMRKQYYGAQNHGWDWVAFITPLGIAGYWGADFGYLGYLWLYKKEWAREGAFPDIQHES